MAARLKQLPAIQRRSRGTVMPGAETAAEEDWKPFLWKHNALRHSFISYRVAQVALEAGNSPGMIFKHYRELVRPAAAKAWFALGPGAEKQKVGKRKAASHRQAKYGDSAGADDGASTPCPASSDR